MKRKRENSDEMKIKHEDSEEKNMKKKRQDSEEKIIENLTSFNHFQKSSASKFNTRYEKLQPNFKETLPVTIPSLSTKFIPANQKDKSNNENEEWYEIPNAENYLVSKDGEKVKNKKNNKIQFIKNKKRPLFNIVDNDKKRWRASKQCLLARTFPFLYDDGDKWLKIPGYEDYCVSDGGNIFSLQTKRMIKGTNSKGYITVYLHKDKVANLFFLHQLVARTFLGPPPTKLHTVNHINGIKNCNKLSNLEFSTMPEQINHAFEKNLITKSNRPVIQMDLKNNEIATYESMTAAALATDSNRSDINTVCLANTNRKTCNGFKWKYKFDSILQEEIPNEEWKILPVCDKYEISSHGRIRNGKKKILRLSTDGSGYKTICLHMKEGLKRYFIHRLVAICFVPNDNIIENVTINHINSNRSDNFFENLEWCSQKINNLKSRNSRKIEQIDPKSKNVIKLWDCIRHVCDDINGHWNMLTAAIKKQTLYKNFIWKYYTDNNSISNNNESQ